VSSYEDTCIDSLKEDKFMKVVLALKEMVCMDTMNSVHKPHLSVQKSRRVQPTARYFNTPGAHENPSCLLLRILTQLLMEADWTRQLRSLVFHSLGWDPIKELHTNVDPAHFACRSGGCHLCCCLVKLCVV
jgi:hypothetical protein